jgi:hypothetical protein
MSTLPDNELDLEKLFLPAWAQEPASAKSYASYEGRDTKPDRGDDRRGGRRPGPRRDGPPSGPRGNRPPGGDRRGPRPGGDRGRSFSKDRPQFDRGEPRERRETPPPMPEVNVALLPDEKGVESLARQIKMTGRAYPLFDIARLILQKPERYAVGFSIRKKADGQVAQPLFLCALDDTLWLSEDEAIEHVLKKHFATFYQAERTATEKPKGTYTFVAQCGMSGAILGPPNHHDYQNQLRKLHAERFSRMPFEAFKARVRIVRDEEIVKKWIDDQSWKTEYVCLNVPEALRLPNMEAVGKHFREVHKESIIKSVESHTLSGVAAKGLRSPSLTWLVRQSLEDQKRFPLQIATALSQQFAGHGLQFFKVNKTVTHVSVARPHYLDVETTPVSDGIKAIVDYINTHPKTTRRKLMEALAPAPAAPTTIPVAPVEGVPAAAEPAGPTPEQTAVIADLHWLIHQGHVIEFANGVVETAKKPLPKPPKPERKPAQKTAEVQPAAEPPVEGEVTGTVETAPESIAEAAPSDASTPDENARVGEISAPPAVPTEAPPPPGESNS